MTTREINPTAVAARTAIITLRLRKPSARRQARDGTVTVVAAQEGASDPDGDSTSVSLELLRAEPYLEIASHDRGTRDVLKIASLPAGRRLASGSYLVPVASVERLYDRLAERAIERSVLVGKFIDAYPAIVADAAQRLKGAFDARMFPGVTMQGTEGTIDHIPVVQETATMRAAFSMDYELEVADREAGIRAARGLSQAFVQRELQRARDSGAALVAEIQDGLRVAFADLIDKATGMLTPAAEGERKVFRAENLEKVQAFIGAFAERNVAGDGDLATLVAQARELLRGATPEALKDAKAKTEREALGRALAGIQERLAPLVETVQRPRRKITIAPAPAQVSP